MPASGVVNAVSRIPCPRLRFTTTTSSSQHRTTIQRTSSSLFLALTTFLFQQRNLSAANTMDTFVLVVIAFMVIFPNFTTSATEFNPRTSREGHIIYSSVGFVSIIITSAMFGKFSLLKKKSTMLSQYSLPVPSHSSQELEPYLL